MFVSIENCNNIELSEDKKYVVKNNGNKMIVVRENDNIDSFSTLHYKIDELNRIVRLWDNKVVLEIK